MMNKVNNENKYREVFTVNNKDSKLEQKITKEANEMFDLLFGDILRATDFLDTQER